MEITRKEAAVFVKMLSESTVKVVDAKGYVELLEKLRAYVATPEGTAPVEEAVAVEAPVSA